MTLADLRRLTIKKNLRIGFRLQNGMECVVNEHGLAQVSALNRAPAFNLERELECATEFSVEETRTSEKKAAPKRQAITREQLRSMSAAASGAAVSAEHDDE